MNPIDRLFAEYRTSGRKAFIPFLPAGDPDLAFSADALRAVAEAGASFVEVGFPFSDPIADGPVIQASYTRALDRGLTIDELFAALKTVTTTPRWATPVVGMASYSLVWRRGPKIFLTDAKAAGLAGLVVPDLPVEEAGEFGPLVRDAGLTLTLLVAPTTTPDRAERTVRACSGFVYVVSVVGITGARDRLPTELKGQLARLRTMTDLPLCVGFGVSKPDQVRELKGMADGVIVGSAFARLLEPAATPPGRAAALAGIRDLASTLSGALR